MLRYIIKLPPRAQKLYKSTGREVLNRRGVKRLEKRKEAEISKRFEELFF